MVKDLPQQEFSNPIKNLPDADTSQVDLDFLDGVFDDNFEVNFFDIRFDSHGVLQTEHLYDHLPEDFRNYIELINKFLPLHWHTDLYNNLLFPIRGGRIVLPKDSFPALGIDFHRLALLIFRFENYPQIHLGFAANLLQKLTKVNPESFEAQYFAKLALYIFCPLAEILGETDLLIQLQEAAFRVISPSEYLAVKYAWEIEFGRRLTTQEVQKIGEEIRLRIAGIIVTELSPQAEYLKDVEDLVEVTIRQKSLLSYAQKGGEVNDPLAVTVGIKLELLFPELSEAGEVLQYILEKFIEQNKALITKVGEVKNTFKNEVYGDKRYQVVKAALKLAPEFAELEDFSGVNISFSVTTNQLKRVWQIIHTVYKRFVRQNGDKATWHHAPLKTKHIDALSDYSMTLLRQLRTPRGQVAAYAIRQTRELEHYLRGQYNESSDMIFIHSVKGSHIIPVPRSVGLLGQLQVYSNEINHTIKAKYFRVKRKSKGEIRSYIIHVSGKDAIVYNAHGDPVEGFELQDFDYISAETAALNSNKGTLTDQILTPNDLLQFLATTHIGAAEQEEFIAKLQRQCPKLSEGMDDLFLSLSDVMSTNYRKNFYTGWYAIDTKILFRSINFILECWRAELININRGLKNEELALFAREAYGALKRDVQRFLNISRGIVVEQ